MELGRLDEGMTANVGTIDGGTAENVVPGHCWIVAEARSIDFWAGGGDRGDGHQPALGFELVGERLDAKGVTSSAPVHFPVRENRPRGRRRARVAGEWHDDCEVERCSPATIGACRATRRAGSGSRNRTQQGISGLR